MKVFVKCFSQVKYAVGTSELALDLNPGSTTADLETMIREKSFHVNNKCFYDSRNKLMIREKSF